MMDEGEETRLQIVPHRTSRFIDHFLEQLQMNLYLPQ